MSDFILGRASIDIRRQSRASRRVFDERRRGLSLCRSSGRLSCAAGLRACDWQAVQRAADTVSIEPLSGAASWHTADISYQLQLCNHKVFCIVRPMLRSWPANDPAFIGSGPFDTLHRLDGLFVTPQCRLRSRARVLRPRLYSIGLKSTKRMTAMANHRSLCFSVHCGRPERSSASPIWRHSLLYQLACCERSCRARCRLTFGGVGC